MAVRSRRRQQASPYLGCHLPMGKGYRSMGEAALGIGADTFAFFPRPPRGGAMRALDEADLAALAELWREDGFGPLVAHAPYIYNLAAAKPEIRERSLLNMAEDLERLDVLGGLIDEPGAVLYNFHPGAHVGQGADVGMQLVAEALAELLEQGHSTRILLETMAGKGSELGRSFEELAAIIEAAEEAAGPDAAGRLGVCLDTCHIHDGGYDVAGDVDGVLDEFERILGPDRLAAIHVNDSKNPLGAAKDRNEKLGEGHLGAAGLRSVVVNPRLAGLPMILETPHDELDGYAREIALMRSWIDGEDAEIPKAPKSPKNAKDSKKAKSAKGSKSTKAAKAASDSKAKQGAKTSKGAKTKKEAGNGKSSKG